MACVFRSGNCRRATDAPRLEYTERHCNEGTIRRELTPVREHAHATLPILDARDDLPRADVRTLRQFAYNRVVAIGEKRVTTVEHVIRDIRLERERGEGYAGDDLDLGTLPVHPLLLIETEKGARQGAVQPVVHGKVIAGRIGGVARTIEQVGKGIVQRARVIIRDAHTACVIEGIIIAVIWRKRHKDNHPVTKFLQA